MKHNTSAHAGHDHDNSAMHSGQRLASVHSGGGSKYTCPMHPTPYVSVYLHEILGHYYHHHDGDYDHHHHHDDGF